MMNEVDGFKAPYTLSYYPSCQHLVGVDRMFESVWLAVCPQHNSKTNDPKVFKLDTGNDLGIS